MKNFFLTAIHSTGYFNERLVFERESAEGNIQEAIQKRSNAPTAVGAEKYLSRRVALFLLLYLVQKKKWLVQ